MYVARRYALHSLADRLALSHEHGSNVVAGLVAHGYWRWRAFLRLGFGLHVGELKELGRVDNLLTVQDVTQIQAKGLSDEAKAEIRQVIEKHGGDCISIENPTSTLEELFLGIVRDSEARPGRRARTETTDTPLAQILDDQSTASSDDESNE